MFLQAFNFGLTMLSTLFGFVLGIEFGSGITLGGLFFVVLTFSIVIGWLKKALGFSAEGSGKMMKGKY